MDVWILKDGALDGCGSLVTVFKSEKTCREAWLRLVKLVKDNEIFGNDDKCVNVNIIDGNLHICSFKIADENGTLYDGGDSHVISYFKTHVHP